MYEDTICKCCQKPLAISLNPTQPDEKLAFVENVCRLLVESRFGPDRPFDLIADFTGGTGPHLFYDLTLDGPIPSYYVDVITDSMTEAVISYFLAQDRAAAMERFRAIEGQTGWPANLGRGSPELARSAASGQ